MRDLSISTAWEDTKAVIGRDGRLFASVALALIVLPTVVVGVIDPRLPNERNAPLWLDFLTFAISLLSLAGQLAIIRLALPPSVTVGGAVAHGFLRLGKYFLALLILILGVVLLAMPVVAIAAAMGWAGSTSPESMADMTPASLPGPLLLLLFVFLLAMIAIGVRFLLAMPVASAERAGPLDILKRSWTLTSHHWFRLFGFLLVIVLAAATVLAVVTMAVGSVVKLTLGPVEPMSLAALITALFEGAVTGVFSVLFTLMLTRIYVQLSGRDSMESAA